MRVRSLLRLGVILASTVLLCGSALAGGEALVGRGARAMGRAGAFVAGADDGMAFFYNPAGLVEIDGISILVDGAFILQRVDYDRVDSGGNQLPRVSGKMEVLPIPTLVITWKPKKVPWFTLAGGIWTPYLGVNSYPQDGPQRYSNVDRKGSLLTVIELAAAFRLHRKVWLGVGFQSMFIKYRIRSVLSGCTELSCAPEDPGFDAINQLDVMQPFVPSGIAGLTILPRHDLRIGLAVQLPFWIAAKGASDSRLPSDPMFEGAVQVGNQATLNFNLPVIARAGIEWRPRPPIRLELALTYEAWSMHKELTVEPHGIYIDNVPGVGRYYVKTMTVPLAFRDTVAIQIGGEVEVVPRRLSVRAGYLWENAAVPDETMTVLTPDGMHNMLTYGLSVHTKYVRLDLSYAHLFTEGRTVTNSRALQLNPIETNAVVPVGNGRYQIATDIIAVGLNAHW